MKGPSGINGALGVEGVRHKKAKTVFKCSVFVAFSLLLFL